MAKKTTTKTPAKKSTTAAKVKTARKATVRKAAAQKSTPSSSKPKSTTRRAKSAPRATPAGPREEKLASGALKLVDEAAALLRKGIRSTATVSAKNREETRKRAHGLLTQAASSLGGLLDSSTSALHKAISKL